MTEELQEEIIDGKVYKIYKKPSYPLGMKVVQYYVKCGGDTSKIDLKELYDIALIYTVASPKLTTEILNSGESPIGLMTLATKIIKSILDHPEFKKIIETESQNKQDEED